METSSKVNVSKRKMMHFVSITVMSFSMLIVILGMTKQVDNTYMIYGSSLLGNVLGIYMQTPKKTTTQESQTSDETSTTPSIPLLRSATPRLPSRRRRYSSDDTYDYSDSTYTAV